MRGLCAVVILAAAGALIAVDRRARGPAEVFSLLAIAVAALTAPVVAVARRLARYPAKGLFELSRRGFRLPWLNREAPGPEGPWEALRGFGVRPIRGGRILVLELAAGRFALTDRSLGEKAFDAAVEALEKAVGPEGVLLGTLVRLPIHPTDRRGFLERKRPWLVALAVVALFVLLASQATLLAIRVASALGAFFATLGASAAQSLNRVPTAELVLALDGLIVPLPDDLRRTVKIPLEALRGNSFEDEDGAVVLVIEHEHGRLRYPVEWFDVRDAGPRDRRREGIEGHYHQIEQLDAVFAGRVDIFRVIPPAEDAAENLRMQRLHAAVHHFREGRVLGDFAGCVAVIEQKLARAARAIQLHARGRQLAGQFGQAALIANANEGPLNRNPVHED